MISDRAKRIIFHHPTTCFSNKDIFFLLFYRFSRFFVCVSLKVLFLSYFSVFFGGLTIFVDFDRNPNPMRACTTKWNNFCGFSDCFHVTLTATSRNLKNVKKLQRFFSSFHLYQKACAKGK